MGSVKELKVAGHSHAAAPRVAIVHYWLVTDRGGERVLERLCRMFPDADLYTHVLDPATPFEWIGNRRVQTTFINRLPRARRMYQSYVGLMPLALEQLDLTGYDLVISSESGPAKGCVRNSDAVHVCYVHSPMRYIWDLEPVYRKRFSRAARLFSRIIFHYMRLWDFASAQRVDHFIANSRFVARRIEMTYRRPSNVVHPPVAVRDFAPNPDGPHDYYLWVGQLVPYKRPELAVEACTRLGRKLVVVGEGAMLKSLKATAGPTIEFAGRASFDDLRRLYSGCRALLFTGEEDFGITPVEVMASGRPVLALAKGGALETVVAGRTGVFFDKPTIGSLCEGIAAFERWLPSFDPKVAVNQAALFSNERFDEQMGEFFASLGFNYEAFEPASNAA